MIRLSTNILGVFAVKNGRIIKHILFSDDAVDTAKQLAQAKDGICEIEEQLITELKSSGTEGFLVNKPSRFREISDIVFEQDDDPPSILTLAGEIGYSTQELKKIIHAVNIQSARAELMNPEKDQLIIQAVRSLDELEDEINLLSERLREWYSLHYPELNHIVAKNDVYALLVAEGGDRSNMASVKAGFDKGFLSSVSEASVDSFGFELSEKDVGAVQSLARGIVALCKAKSENSKYLEKAMAELAPNVSHLCGPSLGAKFIAKAGSLKKMALLPAGTIQILGAEDAFFKFLKTGKNPPKHGIIFTHPDIRSAKKSIRGKLSRTLAAKIAIAAKSDAFKGEFIAEKLKNKFKERIKQLNQLR